MAITQGQVTLDEAAVIDKRLQCVSRVESGSGNTVLNEVFCLIDPDDGSSISIAKVLSASPSGSEFGLVVRNIPSGTQNIGDGGGSITIDTPQLPGALVGGRLDVNIGAVGVGNLQVDIRRGQTLKFAPISAALSGNNTIIAAVAANKIKVVSYVLVADGTVNVTFQSGAGGTNLSGAMALVANSGIAIAGTPGSWLFETAVNTLLNINLSAAVGVRGHIAYFEEA